MQITSKGQVTIPVYIREALGFLPHTEVEFKMVKGRVFIEKVEHPSKRGKAIIDNMRGQGSVNMSTEEILALTRGDE